jgi:prepilin-type processing-associated H-X9-DG protein
MQCGNQLKQLMLAMFNYEDTFKALPGAGGNAGPPEWRALSEFIFILPFFEQGARYEQIQSTHPGFKQNSTAYSNCPGLSCPSDGNTKGIGPFNGHQTCNYCLSYGDSIYYVDGAGDTHGGTKYPGESAARGAANNQTRGAFRMCMRWCTLGAITDGTSNTIAISETNVVREAGSRSHKTGGLVQVGSPAETPQTCLTAAFGTSGNRNEYQTSATVRTKTMSGNPPADDAAYRGCTFVWNESIANGFVTALPPNGPHCIQTSVNNGREYGLLSVTSNHSGGVNAVYCDGSTHFISETINTDLSATCPKLLSGKSPYGVWGALGTIAGSESVAGP